jgi:hypothetical protein
MEKARKSTEEAKKHQEEEKGNIEREWRKLTEEKRNLENMEGLNQLNQEKKTMELQMKLNVVERSALEEKKWLTRRISELEMELNKEKKGREEQAKRHDAEELEELENTREMAMKNIEQYDEIEKLRKDVDSKEREIHRLINEVHVADKPSESLASTSEKTSDEETVDGSSQTDEASTAFTGPRDPRIRCVLCPPSSGALSTSGFLFHIARAHMFDEWRVAGLPGEAAQVQQLLGMLEGRARREVASQVRQLEDAVRGLQSELAGRGGDEGAAAAARVQGARVARLEGELAEQRRTVGELMHENTVMERDIKGMEELRGSLQDHKKNISILEVESADLKNEKAAMEKDKIKVEESMLEHQNKKASQKKEMARLKDGNAKLQKEKEHIEKSLEEEKIKKRKTRQDLKDEESKKRKLKRKWDMAVNEAELMTKKASVVESDLDRFTMAVDKERKEVKQERVVMMQRIRSLEAAEDELIKKAAVEQNEVADEVDVYETILENSFNMSMDVVIARAKHEVTQATNDGGGGIKNDQNGNSIDEEFDYGLLDSSTEGP